MQNCKERLQVSIARLQDEIARLQGQIAGQQGEIAGQEGEIAGQQEEIERLQGPPEHTPRQGYIRCATIPLCYCYIIQESVYAATPA